ncbi:telomeric repeat-binding factor 2-interacting protein 1-like isoform X1 [Branchiostoma floridae]|uniref:Telomeric repeat-binding factor 2-interacting protein 1 n=1 Tax=Branchiostoma floridae TaxID=7739 RepID=A0A9J7L6C7_BRAFL|nr:telomeric repeat-binding factor 2-interacting protein 1-like isoform X1 [Branchiostoma floridae]
MAGPEFEFSHSNVLFQTQDGIPLTFYCLPGEVETLELIGPLVKHGGGIVTNRLARARGEYSIKLAADGKGGEHMHMYSYKYILDCVERNALLPLEPYKVSTVVSSDSATSAKGARREHFERYESINILMYIAKHGGEKPPVSGKKMWKDMQLFKVTKHPWSSMRSHYLKQLRGNEEEYQIKDRMRLLNMTGKELKELMGDAPPNNEDEEDINDMVNDNLGKEKAKMQPEVETGVPPYMVHNANMPPDVESLPEYAEVGNQPHLKTFLTKQQNMNHLTSPAPYASTSVVDTNLNENLNLEKSVSENGSEKWMPTFTREKRKNERRTPDAYTPDHKVNNDIYPQENSEGSQMSTSLSNPMYDNRPRSPYSDGSATDASSRRRRRAQNKPLVPPLNWADLLTPAPEHPPPSKVDSSPGTLPRSPYSSSHRSDRPTPDSPNTDVTLPCLPAHLEDTGQEPGLRIELPGYGYLDAPSDADTSVRDEDFENRDYDRERHLGEQTPASSMGDLESSVTGNRDSMIAG